MKHGIDDLKERELRHLSNVQLRYMWLVVAALEAEYIVLERHRLRPRRGSLLDILFAQEYDGRPWTINANRSIERLLAVRKDGRPMYIGPQRQFSPQARTQKLLGTQTLSKADTSKFDDWLSVRSDLYEGLSLQDTAEGPKSPARENNLPSTSSTTSGAHYLERFRPLLGIPYGDATPAAHLVTHREPSQAGIAANCYWAYESTTRPDESALGLMLIQCANNNRERERHGE